MEAGLKTYRKHAARESRDQLIMDHLGMVRRVLGRVSIELPDGVDTENLEAAGILGLVEAAGRFDATHGAQFQTFAYPRIRGAILDELRRNCPLPQTTLQHWSLIREAWKQSTEIRDSQGLADVTGLTVRQVEDCLVAIRMTRPEVWSDDLPVRHLYDEASERDEQGQRLAAAIEELSEQSRTVVTLYHLDGLTLKEIGAVLQLSESRVSRVLAGAELQLKGILQHGK